MKVTSTYPHLFQAGRINSLNLKNRIVMAPMGTGYPVEGKVTRRVIAYFTERARGGVGLIETGYALVDKHGGGEGGLFHIGSDEFIFGHSDLIEPVHAFGAKICMQLNHSGTRPENNIRGDKSGSPPDTKIAIPGLRSGMWLPHEMTSEDIDTIIEQFGDAAKRAKQAGYDAVDVHGGHGHCLHLFLSPHTNRRSDEYGGSLDNRIRLPVEVIKNIRQKVGRDFPIIFRLTAVEIMNFTGYTIEDAQYFARKLAEAGVDAIHVTMGSAADRDGIGRNGCPMSYPQGWRVPYIKAIKEAVSIPVIGVGAFKEPDLVEKTLADGVADFIALGRPLLADPSWVDKAGRAASGEIRKCISCNYCHAARMRFQPVHCTVNAALGREEDFAEIKPSFNKKKVMIIGSGPGGMEAARVAALRGHEVSLYEKGDRLGAGQLKLAEAPPHKEKMKWVKEYFDTALKNSNIKIQLNTEVDARLAARENPDVVIVATGARPLLPDIPGINGKNVVTANEVLAGKVIIENKQVIVLGQYTTGAETAEFLAEKGNRVTIIARSPAADLARGLSASNRPDLIFRLHSNKNINFMNGCATREIKPNGLDIAGPDGKPVFVEADWVVVAQGATPVNELGGPLREIIPEVYFIGDATEPRDIATAVYEGSFISRNI